MQTFELRVHAPQHRERERERERVIKLMILMYEPFDRSVYSISAQDVDVDLRKKSRYGG